MTDKIFLIIRQKLHYFTLWGYGWKRRNMPKNPGCYQWRDPMTGVWYRETVAMKLLLVDVLDYYRR